MSSDMVRVTGINSGLDTEAIISAYTSVAQKRVQDAKNSKTLNTWTQDAWKALNTKIYNFYSKTLSTNRLSKAYSKTKVTTSNSCLSVVSNGSAVKGVQTAKVKSTASAAYLTGAEINVDSEDSDLMSALNLSEGSSFKFKNKAGEETTIQIGGESSDANTKVVKTMKDLVGAFQDLGLNANYDAGNKRIFISAKSTGENYDFSLEEGSGDALSKLGLATKEQGASEGNAAVKTKATSAELVLNGATFKSDTNSFVINGSTYTINSMPTDPDEEISVTTATDYDGVYDVVKGMIKEYNDLMNEMSKLYNADSAKDYKPLTEEQKDEMTDKEVEAWEDKIKSALLRNDDTLYDVMGAMSKATTKGFDIGGTTMYLSDFGISTMSYFEAEENERYALHIDGDPDDGYGATKEDKLKSLISSDPEKVAQFFAAFSQEVYTNLYDKMGSSSLSSIYKVYNDKQLKQEATDWDKKILDLEDKLKRIEDKYYQKFASMEKMLASINSKQSSVASVFGA